MQHNNVGGLWGWAEAHPVRPKIMDIDDLASALDDGIRMIIKSPMLISGMDAPSDGSLKIKGTAPTADRPEPGREEMPTIFGGKNNTVNAIPLVMPIDIPGVTARIREKRESLQADLPELNQSIWNSTGNISNEALETLREPVEIKVNKRRGGYDSGFVRAVQMSLAIGGMRRYPGYDGFDLQSYKNGQLDLSIAERPVFEEQASEKRAAKAQFWQGWSGVANTNVTFETYAKSYDWTDEQIAEFEDAQQKSYIPAEGL
jgi:hypothetical protein